MSNLIFHTLLQTYDNYPNRQSFFSCAACWRRITTNLPFTRWEEVLKDKVLCSVLIDRLCHKSYLVNMTGTSHHVKETKKIIENN